jgi:hypothetical protein
MGFSVDKRHKIDKPLGTMYWTTEPRPIEVVNAAPTSETTRDNQIAIKTSKTDKVTLAVAVMSIFIENRCKLQIANCKNEKPSCQKAK